MNLDTITCADALDYLATLPDASVDMVLCDLPYGTTACAWDEIIPFEPLWEQFRRVVKRGAALVLFGSQPFTTKLIASNMAWFGYEWVWEKPRGTGYLNANRNPMKSHENVCVFYDTFHIYNPQIEAGKPYRATSGAAGGFVRDKTVGGYMTINNGVRFPKTVLKYAVETGLHPTQKPVALCEYLIRTYTHPGAVVLDPTCGSGTTGVAARNTGRHYLMNDYSQEYVDIARRRLAEPYTLPLFQETTPEPQAEQMRLSL